MVRHDFSCPNPKFWRHPIRPADAHAHQSFHFQKIPGGLNFNIFGENCHAASFYIKEQVQAKKLNLSFKNYNFWPRAQSFHFQKILFRHQNCATLF